MQYIIIIKNQSFLFCDFFILFVFGCACSLFKECPHPDEKQRLELSKRLCLETRQVKFWFQNRRTQMKVKIKTFFFLGSYVMLLGLIYLGVF